MKSVRLQTMYSFIRMTHRVILISLKIRQNDQRLNMDVEKPIFIENYQIFLDFSCSWLG